MDQTFHHSNTSRATAHALPAHTNRNTRARVGRLFASIATYLLVILPMQVMAQGLSKGKGIIERVTSDIYSMVTALAVLILIVMGIAYAAKWMSLEGFMRWLIGCVIVGCAAELARMIFG